MCCVISVCDQDVEYVSYILPVADPGIDPEVLKVLVSLGLKVAMDAAALSMGLMYVLDPTSNRLTWSRVRVISGK